MYESVNGVVKSNVWEILKANDEIDIFISKMKDFSETFEISKLENGGISFSGTLESIIYGQQLLSSMWSEAKRLKNLTEQKTKAKNTNTTFQILSSPESTKSIVQDEASNLKKENIEKGKSFNSNTCKNNNKIFKFKVMSKCSYKSDKKCYTNKVFVSNFLSNCKRDIVKNKSLIVCHVIKNKNNDDRSNLNETEALKKESKSVSKNAVSSNNSRKYSSFTHTNNENKGDASEETLNVSYKDEGSQDRNFPRLQRECKASNLNNSQLQIISTENENLVKCSAANEVVSESRAEASKFECKMCEFKYRLKSELKRHLDKQHPITYACPHCSYKSSKKVYYIRHMKTVHEKLRPYTCENCDLSFKRTDALKQHQIVHRSDNEVPPNLDSTNYCKICQKIFRSAFYLKEHMLTHSEKRSYLCEICGATFKTRPVYRNHLKLVHLQEVKFLCNICNKTFVTKFSLKRHMAQHDLSSDNIPTSASSPEIFSLKQLSQSDRILDHDKSTSTDTLTRPQQHLRQMSSQTEEEKPFVAEFRTDVSLFADCQHPENFDLCIDDQIPYVIQSSQDVINE